MNEEELKKELKRLNGQVERLYTMIATLKQRVSDCEQKLRRK